MTIVLEKLPNFCRFVNKCTQGIVGKCVLDNKSVVWKIAKKVDFTCESEYMTGRAISESHLKILPHFVKVISCKNVYLTSCDIAKRKCLFMEDIKGGNLLDVILNCGENKDVMGLIYQILLTLAAGQNIINFTHYDLHIENVRVKTTRDDIHVYILSDGAMYTVETNGLCPVIIDYGFSHTSKAKFLLPSIYHNEAGFHPQHFNPLADVMTLLCSVSVEFDNPRSRLLLQCKNLFKVMGNSLNWEVGWFEGFTNIPKTMRKTLKQIPEVRSDSILRDIPLVIDILQSLISLPITPQYVDHETYVRALASFYYYWFLVEEYLSNTELEGILLKTIVSCMNDKKCVQDAVYDVLGMSFDIDYCTIQNSLRVMSMRIQTILLKLFKKDLERRDNIYSKLPVSNALDVFKRLEKNKTVYGKDDRVKVFDLRNGSSFSFTLSKTQARNLNKNVITIENVVLSYLQ